MADRPRDLLPPNRTPLERHTARALAGIQRVPIPLRTLWNPHTCPAHLLPYLAWAFSVEHWDPAWPAARKRQAIADSWYVHRKKGTHAAVRRVIELLGHQIEQVTEWWQVTPPETPGTWWLRVLTGNGISESGYDDLVRLIDDAHPVTRHLTGLDIITEVYGTAWAAANTQDGDATLVYPHMPEYQVAGSVFTASGMDVVDITTVYPR